MANPSAFVGSMGYMKRKKANDHRAHSVSAAQLNVLEAEIRYEMAHYKRCLRLLRRVDATVLEAGRELFADSPGLGLWLCSPARALGGKVPLDAMRTQEGREKVANILRAVAHGAYL